MLCALLLSLCMASARPIPPEFRVVEVKVGPVHREILRASDRFLDIEGAMRSAKTWTILIKLRRLVEEYPGIFIAIARWTDEDLHQKLVPDWRNICALMGISHGVWSSQESCYDFPNASRVYCVHLKTSQKDNKFSKVRGLTVSVFYIDQLEEVPEDIYKEAALRLSQKNKNPDAPLYPQMMIVSPNPVPTAHWIATTWPTTNIRPGHRYIKLSIYDNRHNLPPETIAAAEQLYPPGHPQHRTKILGERGLDVSGTPVYFGAFMRSRHERSLEIHPQFPLCEAYDYGFHRPCVIWYQYAPWGWVRVLGGVLGSDMHLDAFLPVVERYRDLWFPKRLRIDATCDPAGANENAQGLRGTPVGILRDWYREHGERDGKGDFVTPRYLPDANHPERRWAADQMLATYMRHRVNGDEAFLVDPERWVIAELNDERFEPFFLEALEAGYVLEDAPRHSQKLGSFWVPKKDGYYEHPMNCLEYGALAHVQDLPLSKTRATEAVAKHERQLKRAEARTLREAQKDKDPDDRPLGMKRARVLGGRQMGRRGRRGGY